MTGVAAQGVKWNRRPKGRGEGRSIYRRPPFTGGLVSRSPATKLVWITGERRPGGWITEPLENSKEG